MTTALFTHPACLAHETPPGHPESAARLRAVLHALEQEPFQYLLRQEAAAAPREAIERVHSAQLIDDLQVLAARAARNGFAQVDGDTIMSAGSFEAALYAAGAALGAVDLVLEGRARNAFCAVRPPGHHAEPATAMGFCLFNNVAVGALHARAVHGLARVAVVDFDVHHGNGTQDIAFADPDFFYASVHQAPLYPGTGRRQERGVAANVVNVPLPEGAGGLALRASFTEEILPALGRFRPDFVFISAGFDGHHADPLAGLCFTAEDFAWATAQICALAAESCDGRVVSLLEGGYDLGALARSAASHVAALMASP